MKNSTAGQKDLKPKLKTIKVSLLEEDLDLLEKSARRGGWQRSVYAGILLTNAILASWAYSYVLCDDRDRASDRDYFLGISRLQEEALKAANSAKDAAAETARRYQQWIDAEKVRRDTRTAGLKVIDGKFRPAPKGSGS